MFRTGWCSSGTPAEGKLRQAFRQWSAALWLASGVAVGGAQGFDAQARTPENPAAMPTVALATLPVQAQETHRRIYSGGPFPYSKDGVVFGNRERRLPSQPRGHYREYTVKTPGAKDRGARRIVCGGKPPTQPEACFYTEDHYISFRRIVQ